MGFVAEFKEFAVKGNVVDMAVGIIIGAAFGKIVTSFVGDVVMPIVGKATGRVNFTDKFIVLGDGSYPSLAAAKEAGAAVLAYGAFIQSIIDFVIIALCIFTMIKWMNKLKKKEETKEEAEKEAEPPEEVLLLRQIRDQLKRANKKATAGKPAAS